MKSIKPNKGPTVTITGSAVSDASDVMFNGVSTSFSMFSDTKITAEVPVGATSGIITVVGPNGQGISKRSFTVNL